MADWVIFYHDGSSYSSEDGPAEGAPRDGVQCIAVADISCGNYVLAEQNYYCWHHDEDPPQWVPHDNDGLRQYRKFNSEDRQVVLHGYWIARERYARIRVESVKDPRLPQATARPPRQPEGS